MYIFTSLKSQLIASLIFTLLSISILSVFIYLKLNELSEITEKTYMHPFTVSNAARDAGASIISMHRYMKDVTLSTTNEEILYAIDAIKGKERDIYLNFSLINSRFLGNPRLIKNVVKDIKAWSKIKTRVIDLVQKGKIEEAAYITKHEGAELVELIEKEVRTLIEFANDKASDYVVRSQEAVRTATIKIIGLLLLVCLIGTALGYNLLQSIRRQILLLKSHSHALTKGDYSTPIVDIGISEICALSRHLEEIRISTRNKTADLLVANDAIKAANEIIRREQNFTNEILNTAQAIILVLDLDGCIVQYNSYMEKITGYQLSDVKGKNWFKIFLPNQNMQKIQAVFEDLLSKKEISFYVTPIISKSGEECLIEWHNKVLVDKHNHAACVISIGIDITARNLAESSLKQSKSELQLTLEAANLGLWNWRPHTNEFSTNDIFLSMLGYENDEYPNTIDRWLPLIHPDDLAPTNETLQPFVDYCDDLYRSEYRMRASDNDWKWILDIGRVMQRNSGGSAILFVGVHIDITQQKEAEQELIAVQQKSEIANKAKAEFLANISHELRTPLHGIIGFTSLGLKNKNELTNEKVAYFFENIQKSSDRLLMLINDLLDISKLESGKMKMSFTTGLLVEIAKNCISEQQARLNESNIEVIFCPESLLGDGKFDQNRITQVVANLLSNAIKYTPKGQHIELCITEGFFDYTTNSQTPSLVFTIRDFGKGIPESELELIFDKFEQSSATKTHAGGTGLGLPICREIIKLHSGRIWSENHPEGGAIFSFIIPEESVNNSV